MAYRSSGGNGGNYHGHSQGRNWRATNQQEAQSTSTFTTAASSAHSAAHSIRSLAEVTKHMKARQLQRGVPDALVRETVLDGLVTDQRNSRLLHVSDNIIVISEDRDRRRLGITTYRHPLLDVWSGDQSATPQADLKTLDTSYFFFQDGEFCFFGGIENREEGIAELGFGKQHLGDTHDASYFEMVSIRSGPSKATVVTPCQMKLEKILSMSAVSMQTGTSQGDSVSVSTGMASRASTVHVGSVHSIRCKLAGEVVSVPILRCLRVSGPAAASRATHSWFEYDAANTNEQRPPFSFKELQAALSACALPLPQFSGRWRLEEVGDWPGFSAYTIIAVPRPDATAAAGRSGSVECMVVALQSNDEEEWKYETFLVGRGRVDEAGAGGECSITATLRRVRLKFSLQQEWAQELEILQGTQHRLRLSSGHELVRIGETPSAPDFTWSKEEDKAPEAAAHALMRQLVPDVLDFAQAVQAGDVDRLQELIPSQDLQGLIRVDSRLGKQAVPIVAAALRGRAEVVELLLTEHAARALPLDSWTLACAGARSPRAAAELLARVDQDRELRTAVCPRDHVLWHLKMDGCTLVEIAVLADGAALALDLVRRGGCEHTLATAVQSGDADWLEANVGRWKARVNARFGRGGGTVLISDMTPLIVAAAGRRLAVVKCLLRHGADPFVRRQGQESTAINYAQVYDQNVAEGFPVLRTLLDAAKRLRAAGAIPSDWAAGARERCDRWRAPTHPAAWSLIEDFEGQFEEDDFPAGDGPGLRL